MSRLVYNLALMLLKFFGYLPLSVSRAIGHVLGRITYTLNTKMVRITRSNIAYCYPDMSHNQKERLIRQSVIQTILMALETAAVWTRSELWVNKRIFRKHNEQLVTKARQNGQGVLILAPHLGNWEVLGIYLSRLGPVTYMYQKPKIEALEAIVVACRQQSGAELVPTDRKGLTKVLKALKQGEISGILPDQTPKEDNSGIFVDFFNRPAYTMTLVHKLLQKSHAAPIFAYAKRVKGGFEIFFEEAPSSICSEDEKTSVQALSDGIQHCVEAIPAQYQWEYKRYKKMPQDAGNIY